MRIALISDILGNLVSLQAVLSDIERAQVDRIVCLGDVAAVGPEPRQVIARLRQLDCPCVMGNYDEHLLYPERMVGVSPWIVDMTLWCAAQLSEEDRAYLRSFLPLIAFQLGPQAALLCYHGSPRSNDERILPTTPRPALDSMLDGYKATVMAGGHNHVQMMRRHEDLSLIDVGSVGQPFAQMPFQGLPRLLPWAEYAVVGYFEDTLSIDLRRVAIDVDEVKRAAAASGMPDAEGWAESWSIVPEGS
jgi:predicted phosphodiesterase